MFLLIDNYDSFTYNVVHALGAVGAECDVHRNDTITVAEVMAKAPTGIVISPGPCDPPKAGICVDLIKAAGEAAVPVLGICLGHQSIGHAFGGQIVRGPAPMHGKVSSVNHDGTGLFDGLPSPLEATRYHSLVVDRASLPNCFKVTATTDDGMIMGMEHASLPLHGVQFHPESIASQHGDAMLRNFVALAKSNK